jgi:hypothetical protein
VQGFQFAWAKPEAEAAAEAAAIKSTEAQKALCAKKKLWEKYDKERNKKVKKIHPKKR